MDAALDDAEDPVARTRREGAARTLGPAQPALYRSRDRVALGREGGALVERQRDVGAEKERDLERARGGQQVTAAFAMRPERRALLADRPQRCPLPDLRPS